MKNIIATVAAILFCILTSSAQDTVTLVHEAYKTTYSKSFHYPVLVQWWDTKARVGCKSPLARKDQFAPDPLLPSETNLAKDYVGSGTDRGHMCPAADNLCFGAKQQAECFYFSNMAAQYHSLNAGDWKSLETKTRLIVDNQDSVYVWCGSIGSAKKIGTTTVPTKCWKVIYVKKTKAYEAYIFDNTTDKPKGIDHWKVQIADVEKLTGFKFSMN